MSLFSGDGYFDLTTSKDVFLGAHPQNTRKKETIRSLQWRIIGMDEGFVNIYRINETLRIIQKTLLPVK